MSSLKLIAWLWIGLALIGVGLSLLIPVPPTWTKDAFAFHFPLANSIAYSILHIGAAVLFLMGLNAYKENLQRAYRTIVIGIVIVALGIAQVAVLVAFDLINSVWVQSGAVVLPFVIAGMAIYVGVRSIARQLGIHSPWAQYRVAIPLVALGMIIVMVLPHTTLTIPELNFDISNMIVAFDSVCYLLAALIALKIRSRVGKHYVSAMAWLALGLLASTIITLTTIVSSLVLGAEYSNYIQDIVVIIGGLIYLRAGLAFAKTKEV